MPLLDHFHPPLRGQRHWEACHGWWAAALATNLNDDLLPPEYFAEFQVTLGTRIEVDVATFSEESPTEKPGPDGAATAVQTRIWAPPTPTAVLPACFPDDIAVLVYNETAGPVLVASIELVSPGNKDRSDARDAFTAKCASYLQRGIGLIVVDIVTSRHANLHNELMSRMGLGAGYVFDPPEPIYTAAYRPAHRQGKNEIDLWREPLGLAQSLPTLPLAVRGLGCLPIDLEETYMEGKRRARIA